MKFTKIFILLSLVSLYSIQCIGQTQKLDSVYSSRLGGVNNILYKEIYKYNEKENIDSSFVYVWDLASSKYIPWGVSVHSYFTNDLIKEIYDSAWSISKVTYPKIGRTTYHPNGKLKEVYDSSWSSDLTKWAWNLYRKIYNKNGDILADLTENENYKNGFSSRKTEYIYTGNQTETITYKTRKSRNEKWEIQEKTIARYNANNNLTYQRRYSWSDLDNKLISRSGQDNKYDNRENKIEQVFYMKDENTNGFRVAQKHEYAFDANNNLTLNANYRWNTKMNRLVGWAIINNYTNGKNGKIIYAYDNNGIQTLQKEYNWDTMINDWILSRQFKFNSLGNVTNISDVNGFVYAKYIYDSHDNLIELKTYDTMNRVWRSGTYKLTYDSKGNLMEWVSLDYYGNKGFKKIYTYDAFGNNTSMISYRWNWGGKNKWTEFSNGSSYNRSLGSLYYGLAERLVFFMQDETTLPLNNRLKESLSPLTLSNLYFGKSQYAYDADGNVTHAEVFYWDKTRWRKNVNIETAYDANGTILTEKIDAIGNSSISSMRPYSSYKKTIRGNDTLVEAIMYDQNTGKEYVKRTVLFDNSNIKEASTLHSESSGQLYKYNYDLQYPYFDIEGIPSIMDGFVFGMKFITPAKEHNNLLLAFNRKSYKNGTWISNIQQTFFYSDKKITSLVGKNLSRKDFIVYPNPTQGTINIKGIPSAGTNVTVINAFGQELFSSVVYGENHQIKIDKKGLFFVSIYTNQGILIGQQKVMVQ